MKPVAIVTARSLLTVALTHDYYGGPFSGFTVRPLPATAGLCRRLGLRLTGTDGTLTLAALPDTGAQLAARIGQAGLSARALCWEITPTDPNFAAFTGVDFAGSANALVLASRVAEPKGGRLTVAAEATAADVWPRQPFRFSFRPARALPVGTMLSLQTFAGVTLRSYSVTDPHLVNLDTGDFGSGLYRLMQGHQELMHWFADERAPLAPMRGPVLVLPGALLAAAARRAAETAPPAYTAAFPARSVVWRYHVFNAVDATGLAIEPAPNADALRTVSVRRRRAPATHFHLLPAPVVPGAISFAATQALPLAARAPQRFALTRNGADLCSPLPLAGFAFARSSDGAAPWSDIFVHLQPQ